MKKFAYLVLFLLLSLVLVGCAGVNESYAEKVNTAAEADENYLYADVIDSLGDASVNLTAEILGYRSGVCIWIKGGLTVEEAAEKIEAGEKVYSLTITFLNNEATKAHYGEYDPSEAKN